MGLITLHEGNKWQSDHIWKCYRSYLTGRYETILHDWNMVKVVVDVVKERLPAEVSAGSDIS